MTSLFDNSSSSTKTQSIKENVSNQKKLRLPPEMKLNQWFILRTSITENWQACEVFRVRKQRANVVGDERSVEGSPLRRVIQWLLKYNMSSFGV